jgi:transposase
MRLMTPRFVNSYFGSNKNDAADTEAICEVVAHRAMGPVPINNVRH